MEPSEQDSASQIDADAFVARLLAAERTVREHPAYKAKREWDSLSRSFGIWSRNTQELQELLRVREGGDQDALGRMLRVGPRDTSEMFYMVLDQRLHNMIAAAISLVDHARILVRGYEGQPFESEFVRRSTIVWDEPRTRFLRDLRNYLLHKGHAPLQTRFEMNKGGVMDTTVLLSTEELLDDYEWSNAARRYIVENTPGVHLAEEVATYSSMTSDLYGWAFDQYEHIHEADIAAVNLLIAERNRAATDGSSTSRRDFDQRVIDAVAAVRADRRVVRPRASDTK